MAVAILASSFVFVAFPAELGFVQGSARAWQPIADMTRFVSGRYNLLPSLHVALTQVTLAAVWGGAGVPTRVLLALWYVLLVVSVLLTHQHHVADVVAGVMLAWAVGRWPAAGRRSREG